MPADLTQDTIDALADQGGMVDNKTKDKVDDKDKKDDLIDIDLKDDKTDDKSGDNKDDKTDDKTDVKPDNKDDLDTKVVKSLDDAGYTEDAITERLKKDGGISDEFVKELKEKIDPDFVDAHVGRLRAELELKKTQAQNSKEVIEAKAKAIKDMNDYIYDTVGGEDKFKTLASALTDKLDKDALAVINTKLASGNKTVVREGLEAAVKEYNNIRGMGGKLMEGDAGQGGDPKVHITKEEYRAIMKTDKYKTDPIYAKKMDAARLSTREEDSERYGNGSYYGFHPDKGRYAL